MTSPSPGTIALIGGGSGGGRDYLEGRSSKSLRKFQPLHKELLALTQETPRVVILPIAEAEPRTLLASPWVLAEMWGEHFRQLGTQVKQVKPLTREDAQQSETVEHIAWSNFVYFPYDATTGISETLQSTPAWEAVLQVYRRGGVVATARPAAMGQVAIVGVRDTPQARNVPYFAYQKLGLAPGMMIRRRFGTSELERHWEAVYTSILSQITPQPTPVAIDRLTALVGRGGRWMVYGKGRVTVFEGGREVRYSRGKEVKLPLPPPL